MKYIFDIPDNVEYGVLTCRTSNGYYEYDFDRADLEKLPPAQPESRWIPVTEATPTEDDDYWATFEAETGRFVDWASWYQGRWVVWIEGSPAPLSNVIAWCYPIEPYKGVTT